LEKWRIDTDGGAGEVFCGGGREGSNDVIGGAANVREG